MSHHLISVSPLSDFGLVGRVQSSGKHVTLADLAGTPRYMAPEQWEGKPHFASDQYALGLVVYEWLAGQPPFEGAIVAQQHLHMPVPSLRLKNPTCQ